MYVWTLSSLERVFRTAWGPDTGHPLDLDAWSPANPARGQCGVSALVLKELIGGDLMRGDVHLDGVRVGGHYWNRCADGLDVDLTREQFTAGEVVVSGWIVEPLPGRRDDVGRNMSSFARACTRRSPSRIRR
jgi:hypothetical protein